MDVDPTQGKSRGSLLELGEITEEPSGVPTTIIDPPEIPYTRNQKIAQVSFICLNTGVLVTTTYLANQEMKSEEDNRKYTLFMWSSGVSIALTCHVLLRPQLRKKIYRLMNAGIYEVYFIATNIFLNLNVTNFTRQQLLGGFSLLAGLFQAKDIASLVSLSHSESIQDLNLPENEQDLIPLLSPNTRNTTYPKFLLPFHLLCACGITAVFFVLRDRYSSPLHNEGVWGNLAAFYLGNTIGEAVALPLDNLKTSYEKIRLKNPTEELGLHLKTLRVLKKGFLMTVPLGIGILLPFVSHPSKVSNHNDANGVEDFITMTAIGILYGVQLILLKREWENPLSNHQITHRNAVERNQELWSDATTQERVCMVAKNYFFSLAALFGLATYMIWIASESEPSVQYAIAALLTSSYFSFFITNYFVRNHIPKPTSGHPQELSFIGSLWERAKNTAHFYSTTPAAIAPIYQYGTTKFSITGDSMRESNLQLLVAAISTWTLWGLTYGQYRSLQMQAKPPGPETPALPAIELAKDVITELKAN